MYRITMNKSWRMEQIYRSGNWKNQELFYDDPEVNANY